MIAKDLRQTPTTIWIKKGTKDELDSYGSRKDSYDDIIKNLLIQNSQLTQKLEQSIPEAGNLLKITENKQREMALTLDKDTYLFFSYTPPQKIIDENYRMNITLLCIQKSGKKINPKQYYKSDAERLKGHLRAVEAVIKAQINPLFKITEERLLDIQEWKRSFKNNGLSERTLNTDVKEEFIKAGLIP